MLRARNVILKEVTFGTGKVGVCMLNHKVSLMLAEGLNGLIIGTSANISGKPSPKTIEEVIE